MIRLKFFNQSKANICDALAVTTRREEPADLAGGKSASDEIAFTEFLLLQTANHRRGEHT